MMTCDEMIAVIQHHKDGGEIEVYGIDGSWQKMTGIPSWDFRDCKYRPYVKPKPKQVIVLETWLIEDTIGGYHGFRTVEVQKGLINEMVEAYDYERKVELLSTREVEID